MASSTSALKPNSRPPGTNCSRRLPKAGDQGFLLGVSDNKLLLDGIPLETGQAERSFAHTADHGRSGQHSFFQASHGRRFRPPGARIRHGRIEGAGCRQADQRNAQATARGTIKINEVKFVAADPPTGDVSIAAQIAAQTLGPEFKQWLNDPQKLLQLIAAAEGAKSGGGRRRRVRTALPWFRWTAFRTCAGGGRAVRGGGTGGGTGGTAVPAAAPAWDGRMVPLQEEEVIQAIRLLTRFGQVAADPNVKPEDLQKELSRDRSQHPPQSAAVAGQPGSERHDATNKTRRC